MYWSMDLRCQGFQIGSVWFKEERARPCAIQNSESKFGSHKKQMYITHYPGCSKVRKGSPGEINCVKQKPNPEEWNLNFH